MNHRFSVLNGLSEQDLLLMDSLGFIKESWNSKHKYVDIYQYAGLFCYDTAPCPFPSVIKPNQLEELVLLMKLGVTQKDIITMLEIKQ